ncbi:MAG: helix-turn-helix transcriptional regulator [Blastocatellia bacterium]
MKSWLNCQSKFGNRLRQLRKEKGLSQEALAYEASLDRSYVGQVERGECNISLINICKLANALNLPPSKLLEFS